MGDGGSRFRLVPLRFYEPSHKLPSPIATELDDVIRTLSRPEFSQSVPLARRRKDMVIALQQLRDGRGVVGVADQSRRTVGVATEIAQELARLDDQPLSLPSKLDLE